MRKILVVLMLLFLVGCNGNSNKITIDGNLEVTVGEEKALLPKTESDKKILFESLDETIATVNANGIVKGIKEGKTKVVVSLEGTQTKVEVNIVVLKPVLVVSLEVEVPNQLKLGDEVTATVTTNDPDGVSFASSDKTIFTVSDTGKVTALKVGTANLTVTSKTDATVKEVIEIEVREQIVINANDINLAVGITAPIGTTHNDPLGVTYEIIGNSISISENNVTGKSEGTSTIKITSKTEPDYSITVSVVVTMETIDVLTKTYEAEVDNLIEIEVDSTGEYGILIGNEEIVSSVEGGFKALSEGVTEIKFFLDEYPEIFVVVEVSVYPKVTIEVAESINLNIQEIKEVPYTSNEELILSSSDSTIFTVDGNNIIGVKGGTASLIFTADANPAFSYEIDITVAPMPTRLTLTASRSIVLSEQTQIINNFTPVGSFSYVTYQSSNENVLTVSDEGVVEGVGIGSATITVTSTITALLNAKITITVERINAVKQDVTVGETVTANGYLFTEGVNLFKTLEEALVGDPKEVILIGTYTSPIDLNSEVVLSGTPETTIKNTINVKSNNATIKGMTFTSAGRVITDDNLSNVVITKNTFKDLTGVETAIFANRQSDLEISYNDFNLSNQTAIHVSNPMSKVISVKGNIINGAGIAILVNSAIAYETNLSVRIAWNKIDSVSTGIDVNLSYTDTFYHANSYVRFNEVTNYESFAAKADEVNLVDFNLNYWGGEPNYAKFANLGEDDLDGYYLNREDIVTEDLYHPNGPAYLKILNDLTEVNIKDVVTVEYKVLPKGLSASSVLLLTSDYNLMAISGNKLTFKRSGFVSLILRSAHNDKINDTIRFEIITDPGIEIIPENNRNNLLVGGELQLNTMVFPSRISETPVKFSVDNETVASISQQGLLTAKAPGLVTVKVELHNDSTVFQTFKVEVYESRDMNNIMDFISASMNTYTPQRTLLMYGATNYFFTAYDSVSRLIFEELFRDKSMMIPDCETLPNATQIANCKLLKPGARPSMIEGLVTYNNKRVHYVTVHETANTNSGHGAWSHAVYLINQVKGTTTLRQASWHFTMDDKALYQHIPTDEMAWHAGDGTRKAGTTWSDSWGNQNIGGGNAHSIGIETSVARGDDIFRIWHRTAKLTAELSKEYNLPNGHVKFHQDFSSKWCPQSMLRAELTWLFYEMVDFEYKLENEFGSPVIEFISHNPEYVDNAGRVIKMPDVAQNVSFTVKVTYNGEVLEKTYYSYLPGTIH